MFQNEERKEHQILYISNMLVLVPSISSIFIEENNQLESSDSSRKKFSYLAEQILEVISQTDNRRINETVELGI